jgi:hypothetical protein
MLGVNTPRRSAYVQPIETRPCVYDSKMLAAAQRGLELGRLIAALPRGAREDAIAALAHHRSTTLNPEDSA